MSVVRMSMLTSSTSLDREALAAAGYDVVEFSALGREIAAAARGAVRQRKGLANPAEAWLSRVAQADKLAVVGVRLRGVKDVHALHGRRGLSADAGMGTCCASWSRPSYWCPAAPCRERFAAR